MATMTITARSYENEKDVEIIYDGFWDMLRHYDGKHKTHEYKLWFNVKTPAKEENYIYAHYIEELVGDGEGRNWKVIEGKTVYKIMKSYTGVFQEILNKYEKQGYKADAKQIALFMNGKISRLILQSK